MNICFPVQKNEGTESRVYDHFGSAPMFLIYDTDTGGVTPIGNNDQGHARGSCNPLRALDGQKVDAVVVGGIGAGALGRLNQAGVRVYKARDESVSRNAALLQNRGLPEFKLQHCCGGHSHGGGCSH